MLDLPEPLIEFDGAVILNAWMRMSDGQDYDLIAGRIQVIANRLVGPDKTGELLADGSEGSGRETFNIRTAQGANFAVIVGRGHNTVLIFGCQVRGFIRKDPKLIAQRHCYVFV